MLEILIINDSKYFTYDINNNILYFKSKDNNSLSR